MVCDIYPRNWQMDHECDGGKQAYAGMYICICRYEELQPAGDAVRRRTAAASSVDGVDSGDRGFEVDVIFARPVLGVEGRAQGRGAWAGRGDTLTQNRVSLLTFEQHSSLERPQTCR